MMSLGPPVGQDHISPRTRATSPTFRSSLSLGSFNDPTGTAEFGGRSPKITGRRIITPCPSAPSKPFATAARPTEVEARRQTRESSPVAVPPWAAPSRAFRTSVSPRKRSEQSLTRNSSVGVQSCTRLGHELQPLQQTQVYVPRHLQSPQVASAMQRGRSVDDRDATPGSRRAGSRGESQKARNTAGSSSYGCSLQWDAADNSSASKPLHKSTPHLLSSWSPGQCAGAEYDELGLSFSFRRYTNAQMEGGEPQLQLRPGLSARGPSAKLAASQREAEQRPTETTEFLNGLTPAELRNIGKDVQGLRDFLVPQQTADSARSSRGPRHSSQSRPRKPMSPPPAEVRTLETSRRPRQQRPASCAPELQPQPQLPQAQMPVQLPQAPLPQPEPALQPCAFPGAPAPAQVPTPALGMMMSGGQQGRQMSPPARMQRHTSVAALEAENVHSTSPLEELLVTARAWDSKPLTLDTRKTLLESSSCQALAAKDRRGDDRDLLSEKQFTVLPPRGRRGCSFGGA